MEITFQVRKRLVPTLMTWVNNSRMKKHLPAECYFIMFLEDVIYFHLSHLSHEYRHKHVSPNLSSYCNNLWKNLVPSVEEWCKMNNVQKIEFNLKFLCDDLRYNTTRRVEIKIDDTAHQDYLRNKSV